MVFLFSLPKFMFACCGVCDFKVSFGKTLLYQASMALLDKFRQCGEVVNLKSIKPQLMQQRVGLDGDTNYTEIESILNCCMEICIVFSKQKADNIGSIASIWFKNHKIKVYNGFHGSQAELVWLQKNKIIDIIITDSFDIFGFGANNCCINFNIKTLYGFRLVRYNFHTVITSFGDSDERIALLIVIYNNLKLLKLQSANLNKIWQYIKIPSVDCNNIGKNLRKLCDNEEIIEKCQNVCYVCVCTRAKLCNDVKKMCLIVCIGMVIIQICYN